MDKQKIMERIAKLMQKTEDNGCTPEEAAAAASMVQKLIAKHHVDMGEFREVEDIAAEETFAGKPWMEYLANIIAENTCCQVVGDHIHRGKIILTFIGKDTDRTAALQIFDKLVNVCRVGIQREKAKSKLRYGTCRNVEHSYAMGFIIAVKKAMDEQCRALTLVVPEEVKAKTHELFPNVSTQKARPVRHAEAYTAGKQDGADAAGQKRIGA
ncbi:DUF2786 domain-containing protein [Selenomonas ruminantium]|uniref:Uncharacterized protein n=1 Tax=Selenomonas ruminantium TaxID=971 RepID=A0A1I0Y9Z5_SELRU|nr:DUF2786 domain-containing protein [Selenomonas ruminantium]SFB10215.1 Protein of unknown function [Selenomonas ruminantium]